MIINQLIMNTEKKKNNTSTWNNAKANYKDMQK